VKQLGAARGVGVVFLFLWGVGGWWFLVAKGNRGVTPQHGKGGEKKKDGIHLFGGISAGGRRGNATRGWINRGIGVNDKGGKKEQG